MNTLAGCMCFQDRAEVSLGHSAAILDELLVELSVAGITISCWYHLLLSEGLFFMYRHCKYPRVQYGKQGSTVQ